MIIGSNGNSELERLLLQGTRHEFLNQMLQARRVPFQIKIAAYNHALNVVSDLTAQLYNLERQFAPSIAFLDGWDRQPFNSGSLELMRDLTSPDAIAYVAILNYSGEIAEDLSERILGERQKNVGFVAGYALGNRLEDRNFNSLGITGYLNSAITHYSYRQNYCIGTLMMQPIIRELDARGDSILTTWINNGRGKRPSFSYCSPAGLWYRWGYRPLPMSQVIPIVNALRCLHESHGITGRNYDPQPRRIADIEQDLTPISNDGHVGRIFADLPKNYEVATLSEYYEPNGHNTPRWDGILMIRGKYGTT